MKKKYVLQYVTSGIIAAAVFLAGVFTQGLLQEKNGADFWGTLSDCFLFPAVFLGGVGAMTWISEKGNFDMIGYGFYYTFSRLLHPLTPQESYYEYKMRRAEGRGGWLKHWLVTGLVCLGASLICLVLYLQAQ